MAMVASFGLVILSAVCDGQPPSSSTIPPVNEGAEPVADGLIASPEPDWPQWRGPRRDGISDEKGLLPAWPKEGPQLRWKIDNLGLGWSSPIIVGNRLFITGDVDDDLVIFAFDLDGKPVWQTKNGNAWTGPYPGARACCVYSEGKLYHMNAHSRVACLDAATGKELWACDLREGFGAVDITWGYSECLLVDGPRLIVTPVGGKAMMVALDKQSGRTRWMTEPLDGDRASHASPILFCHGRRILASCSSSHGVGVDADTGKLLWTVPLRSPFKVNVATPVYRDGSIFYVTAYVYGACYRLRPGEDGALLPEKAWSTTLDSCTGAALLVGDKLFGSGYEKHKSWLCIDWESGKTQYESKGLSTSSAVYADGRFYCLVVDGQAALAKPTAERLKTVGQFRLVPEKTSDAWAYPVVLHGRLYLRYHDTLWCYDVQAK
jgi:outer membrane protein assembly factor BamB